MACHKSQVFSRHKQLYASRNFSNRKTGFKRRTFLINIVSCAREQACVETLTGKQRDIFFMKETEKRGNQED